MDNLNINDFKQWANDPMTIKVRNYLLEHRAILNTLDGSMIMEKAAYSNDLTGLEVLGLESAMRMAAVKSIDMLTDFDDLAENMFKEVAGD